jgi:hypothetical protein
VLRDFFFVTPKMCGKKHKIDRPATGKQAMKQYRIDELRPRDYEDVKVYLEDHYGTSHMEGVYWIPLDTDLLDDVQAAHSDCQPFYFAAVLEPTVLSFELLIRTRNRVRCDCIHYANEAQREYIIALADAIFEELKILT